MAVPHRTDHARLLGLVNGHLLWILVTLVSGILFLGYAKAGSRTDPEVPARSGAGPRPWWEH